MMVMIELLTHSLDFVQEFVTQVLTVILLHFFEDVGKIELSLESG